MYFSKLFLSVFGLTVYFFFSARYAMHINPLKGDPAIILAGKENFACQSRIPAYSYLAAQWNGVSTLQKKLCLYFPQRA
jgi:hypothetical protein